MRTILVATAIAVIASGIPRTGHAYDGPWCAVTNVGRGVHENCSMRTFEMCRLEVIAGNRGFCNPNPRWVGNRPTARRSRDRGYD
jgi:hypothetical protein